jgi:hypothetical protein
VLSAPRAPHGKLMPGRPPRQRQTNFVLHRPNDIDFLISPRAMPPRLNFHAATRALVIRSRPTITSHQPRIAQAVARRAFAKETGEERPATSPNQSGIGHVSEEAVEISQIKGETVPDLTQGTPVQDVC